MLKNTLTYRLTIALWLLTVPAYALEWQESAEVAQLFHTTEVTGTFVLYEVTAQRLIGHNRARAETRFVPASTFKIPNTLIGLSVGAVKTVDEVLPYGGKPQPIKTWEKDMSLREAIPCRMSRFIRNSPVVLVWSACGRRCPDWTLATGASAVLLIPSG